MFILIAGYFKILALKLQNLETLENEDTYSVINNCIKYHLSLKAIVAKDKKLFSGITVIFFGICIFMLCLSTLQLIKVNISILLGWGQSNAFVSSFKKIFGARNLCSFLSFASLYSCKFFSFVGSAKWWKIR